MTYLFGEFELDPPLYELRHRGAVVKLEPKIFDVLAYLIHHRDRVVSKDELLTALWPGEFVSDSVLPRCIATARKALGDTRAKPMAIATVHGRGYRFIGAVRVIAARDGDPQTGAGSPGDSAPETGRAAVFVGREDTMARLRTAFDEACAGRGRMLLLAGEPGIGKTRTAEELVAEAQRRGARVAAGRCHEGEGAPAYWPWVQVLRGCIGGRDVEELRHELGAAAADVALLLPEIAAAPAPATSLPDEARFRLFDAIAGFLCSTTAAQPLVLLIDDLHWADGPSLLLLHYLARAMRAARLLVLGTYRDVELRRRHPLVRVLGDLAREPVCTRVHLSGLGRDDVAGFLAARAGAVPSAALVAAVHEMTEGNPFFMEEVVRLLESEGRLGLDAEPERWGILLPQSVREAIGRRLDARSSVCNRVLAVASVIGRDFDVALLERVLPGLPAGDAPGASSAGPRAEILAGLDEAVSASILTVASRALGRFAFAHALVRQTLYEELSIPLRLNLHQRVAEALEELHADDLEPPLAEIAHHFFQAAAVGSASKAVRYALRAGRHADAVLAYEDAALHYGRALQLVDLNPAAGSAVQRIELLLALGDAQSLSGYRERSQESCRHAAALARKLGRWDLLANAALIFGQRAEAGPLPAEELRGLLEEALAALGDDQPALRSRLLSRLGGTAPYQDSIATRSALGQQAVELARQSGDTTALLDALAAQLWSLLGPDHDQARLQAAAELTRLAERTGQPERLLIAMEHRARTFLALGDLATADRETTLYQTLAEERRQPSFLILAQWYWIARALCDGRFAVASELMRASFALGMRLQHPATKGILLWHLFWSLRQRGDLADFERAAQETFATHGEIIPRIEGVKDLQASVEALVQQFTFSGPFVPSVMSYVYAEVGAEAAARDSFESLAAHDFADVPRDEWWMPTVTHLAEVGAALGDTRRCRALFALLKPFAACNAAHALLRTYGGSVAHYLGLLAAAQRQRETAAGHFEAALAQNATLGARPALVRTQLEYGRLLAAKGTRAQQRHAQELFKQALATAEKLGLGGLVARIQKETLNSP